MQNGKIVLFFLQYTANELLHTANKLFQAFSEILHMEILESDSSSMCCLLNIKILCSRFLFAHSWSGVGWGEAPC